MITKLSESQFHETFVSPMCRVYQDACPPFDFWSCAEEISPDDFEGHQMRETVSWVWEDARRRYQHVLLNTEDKNVFMVIVLDLWKREIFGHRLIDLSREYGLNTKPDTSPNGGLAAHFENPGTTEVHPSVS